MKKARKVHEKVKETTEKITEQVIKEIARSEGIISAIGDGIRILDRNFKVLYDNQVHKNIMGDHIGEYCYKAYGKQESLCSGCPVALTFKDGKVHTVQRELKTDKGTRYLEITTSTLRDSKGNIIAGIEIIRDITERRLIEEAVQQGERFLSSIFMSIQDGISILDRDMKIVRVNSAIEKWYSHAMPLAGKKCFEVYHGRTERCDICPTYKTFKTGDPANEVVPKRGEEGINVGWLDLFSFPFIDVKTGEMKGVIEYVRDITERRKMEEKLREKEEWFRVLFNNVSDAVFVHEVSKEASTPGRFIEVNDIACQYLGYSREELLQMSVLQIDAPETLANVPRMIKEVFSKGRYTWEGIHVRKDGRKIPVEISNQIFDLYGKPMILSTVRDITERKKAEELEHERTDQIILNKEALLELTIMQTPDLEKFSKLITLLSSQVLGVERVSIWFFDILHSEIICESLYTLSKHIHEKGFRLETKDYPKYFEALEEDRVLASDDARTDPRTNALTKKYLKPSGIISMMDAPIRRHGKVIGVVCYEDTEPRQWTYEDQNFAASVAHIITSALENYERKKAEAALKQSEKELKKRVKELEEFYDIAIGRELRMKNLKKEIEELKKELAKYRK